MLVGDGPLDDEVRLDERRRRVVEQRVEDPCRPREGQVRDDPEGDVRQGDRRRVAADDVDVRPAAPQGFRESRVELDRHDPARRPGELGGQPARARADVEDEVRPP